MAEFLYNNFGLVSMVLLAVIAIVLGQKRLSWWKWLNETCFLAFALAEKHGITENVKGADKLKHYLEIYKTEYEKKFGKSPGFDDYMKAEDIAAGLARKEKVVRLADPFDPQATTSTGAENG